MVTTSAFVNVGGGGPTGQAGAVRHGISRALLEYDVNLRPALKRAGLLTRDPRMRERKKYGQKGARKRFQFTKHHRRFRRGPARKHGSWTRMCLHRANPGTAHSAPLFGGCLAGPSLLDS